jgi:hypothetical protein
VDANLWNNVLPEGTLTFTVGAEDVAGNFAPLTSVQVGLDRTAPQIQFNSPASGTVLGLEAPSYNFTVTTQWGLASAYVTVNGTQSLLSISGATQSGNTWTFAGTVPPALWDSLPGNCWVNITCGAVDSAGLVSESSQILLRDGVGPSITITEPVEGAQFQDTPPDYAIVVASFASIPVTLIYYTVGNDTQQFVITAMAGTIDSGAWSSDAAWMPNVTITFYAQDQYGNLAVANVTVERTDWYPKGDYGEGITPAILVPAWPNILYFAGIAGVGLVGAYAYDRSKARRLPYPALTRKVAAKSSKYGTNAQGRGLGKQASQASSGGSST